MAFVKVGEFPVFFCNSTDVKETSFIPAGAGCFEIDIDRISKYIRANKRYWTRIRVV